MQPRKASSRKSWSLLSFAAPLLVLQPCLYDPNHSFYLKHKSIVSVISLLRTNASQKWPTWLSAESLWWLLVNYNVIVTNYHGRQSYIQHALDAMTLLRFQKRVRGINSIQTPSQTLYSNNIQLNLTLDTILYMSSETRTLLIVVHSLISLHSFVSIYFVLHANSLAVLHLPLSCC